MKTWDQPVIPWMIGIFGASEVQDARNPVFRDSRETLPGTDQASNDGRIGVCVTAFLQNIFDGFFIGDLVIEVVEGPKEGDH